MSRHSPPAPGAEATTGESGWEKRLRNASLAALVSNDRESADASHAVVRPRGAEPSRRRVNDETYMDRALELARSVPYTGSNPRVGAVLVRDGTILAEAAHEGAGRAHAEATALAGVDARGATLFVTLEPCSHHGRTPPCAPALAEAGIARVVAAMTDPDERVAGRGFALLADAGVHVDVGLREAEARRMNAAFVFQRTTGLPLATVKLALTLDGRLAAADGSSQWITDPEARAVVHRRRAEVGAVLVGAGTVVADDPSLTARDVGATRQPMRVVADARGVISPKAKIFAGAGEVIVATTRRCPHERQTAYKEAGAEVLVLDDDQAGIDLHGLMRQLAEREVLEVYCEGGSALASSLLRSGLAQRLELFYGPLVVGAGGPALGDVGVQSLSETARWVPVDRRPIGDGFAVTVESADLNRLLQPSSRKGA